MITKYAILKANECNGYWSYYGPTPSYDRYTPIVNKHADRFLNTDITTAVLYDSYEEAHKAIEDFASLIIQEDPKTIKYIGVGYYKVEKVYQHVMPPINTSPTQ